MLASRFEDWAISRFCRTAILMLAVGIGAITTIFTQVNTVFLQTLPVGEPENLRRLSWTSKGSPLPDRNSSDSATR